MMMNLTQSRRGIARWGAAATVACLLALSCGCASPEVSQTSKSLGDEQGDASNDASSELQQGEQGEEQLLERNSKAPRLEVQLESQLGLERYAYTTAKGNIGCPTDLWTDRPPFTVEAGGSYEFCLDVGDTNNGDAAEAKIDVTYKIVGDAEGRTAWFKAGVRKLGLDELDCEVRKADMKTADPNSPYSCDVEWVEGKSTDFPRAWLQLMELGTPTG